MIITWWGKTCFKITGEEGTLIINPPGKDTGFKMPKGPADILVFSEPPPGEAEIKKISTDNTISITTPGEYDAHGFFVFAIMSGESKHDRPNIFIIRHEQKIICHLASYQAKEMTSEDLEQLGNVDILMIPIGGPVKNPVTLSAVEAIKIINQIEPKIVIPMRYAVAASKEKLDLPDIFLKELGASKTESESKLNIKKKESLVEEETKVVVLSPV